MVILIFIMISSYLIVNSHNLFIISWSQLIVNSHTYLLFIVHTSYLFIISYHCHTSPIFIIMTVIVHVLCLFILIIMNNKIKKINNGVVLNSPGDFLIWKYHMLKHRIRFIKDWHQDILFAFFFSKASSSRTTQLLHWGLNSLPDLAELLEYLSFNYLIFPVVLLGKPQDVVAHLTDLSKWLMSLVSQILHLHYRILTIEWRLQNLEHL